MSNPEQFEPYEVSTDFLSIGRTFAEYVEMFDLDPPALAGERVLDCGAGPGSFPAVAATIGADVRAVDPWYARDVDALAADVEAAIERTRSGLEEREGFVWDRYGDVATRIRYLEAAASRFLADVRTTPTRYVAGELPDLPFADDAVDLALVANLLFLYDDRLGEAFHVDAVRELARVADEVRIYPLVGLDATPSAFRDPVRRALRADGHAVDVVSVPYEFLPGATEMLVVEAD